MNTVKKVKEPRHRVFVNGTILVGGERAWLEILTALTAKEGVVPILKLRAPRHWLSFLPFFLRFQEKLVRRGMRNKCRKASQASICFLGNIMEWQKRVGDRNLLLEWLSWLSTLGSTDTRIFDVYAVVSQANVRQVDMAFLRSGRLNSIARL